MGATNTRVFPEMTYVLGCVEFHFFFESQSAWGRLLWILGWKSRKLPLFFDKMMFSYSGFGPKFEKQGYMGFLLFFGQKSAFRHVAGTFRYMLLRKSFLQ